MRRLRPLFAFIVTCGLLVLLANTSCSQQQEGERCDRLNGISGGDSDCNDGLICTQSQDLGTDTDRCCPQDRTMATVAPCTISGSSVTGDAAPPATTDAATETGASDTGTDTGSDTGTDSGMSDAQSG